MKILKTVLGLPAVAFRWIGRALTQDAVDEALALYVADKFALGLDNSDGGVLLLKDGRTFVLDGMSETLMLYPQMDKLMDILPDMRPNPEALADAMLIMLDVQGSGLCCTGVPLSEFELAVMHAVFEMTEVDDVPAITDHLMRSLLGPVTA